MEPGINLSFLNQGTTARTLFLPTGLAKRDESHPANLMVVTNWLHSCLGIARWLFEVSTVYY